MKLIEIKVIFDADDIKLATKEISDVLYEFGIQGLKIEEPFEGDNNGLDYYGDEKKFLQKDYSVSAYFPNNFYAEKKKKMFMDTFAEKFSEREDIIYSIDFYEYDDNFLDAWKKYFFTEKVSERFVVKPTWRDYEKDENELVIEIDPGRAFGTGTHPTTYLCLSLLEKYVNSGDNLLDVGTGSGILMVAGKMLGAQKVSGIDIDKAAVEVAKENLDLNKIDEKDYELYHGDLLENLKSEKFDVVVANILADVILILLKDIKTVLKETGHLVISGIILDKKNEILKKLNEVGMEAIEIMEDKNWVSMACKIK